jgi:hypothetical protein
MARTGKIARLPHDLREEVCRRLLDNQTSAQLLPWLNAQAAAVALWEHEFEGQPANAENLSQWRHGGFREWKERRERVENLKTLSAFAHELTLSGGHVADGAAAVISGQILEALEQAGNLVATGGSDDAEKDPNAGLVAMARAVSTLQAGALSKRKLDLDVAKAAQAAAQHEQAAGMARAKLKLEKAKTAQSAERLGLEREKFESQTVVKFMQFAKTPEALKILNSGTTQQVQMESLRELMFGPVLPSKTEVAGGE